MLHLIIPKESESRKEVLVNISWVLRGFHGGIAEAYQEGSPRRIESDKLVRDTVIPLLPQISREEGRELMRGLIPEHERENLLIQVHGKET